MAKRKHDTDYLAYGFCYIENKGGQKSQCVLCSEVSKLKRHLVTEQPSLKDKSVEKTTSRSEDITKSVGLN